MMIKQIKDDKHTLTTIVVSAIVFVIGLMAILINTDNTYALNIADYECENSNLNVVYGDGDYWCCPNNTHYGWFLDNLSGSYVDGCVSNETYSGYPMAELECGIFDNFASNGYQIGQNDDGEYVCYNSIPMLASEKKYCYKHIDSNNSITYMWWTKTLMENSGLKDNAVILDNYNTYDACLELINGSSETVTVTVNANGGYISYVEGRDDLASNLQTYTQTCFFSNPSTTCSVAGNVEATKEGKKFTGWGTSLDCTEGKTVPEYKFNTSTDLYACYVDVNEVKVTANANGGYISYVEGRDDLASNLQTYTQTCFFSNPSTTCSVAGNVNATKNDKTFTGWGTSSDCTEGKTIPEFKLSESKTLYACYTDNKVVYKVKYNVNGGTGIMANSTHTYGTASNLTANSFSRVGYTFAGWSKTSGGSVEYADKASITNLSSTNGATINLYAVWKPNTYNIKYNNNGGTVTGNPTSGKYDEVIVINYPTKSVTVNCNDNDQKAIIGKNPVAKFEFKGWTSTDVDTNNAYYGDTQWKDKNTFVTETKFKNLSSVNNGSVTLTANWKDTSVKLPSITKDGYTCSWNTKADGKGDNYKAGTEYKLSGSSSSVNLYAICEVYSKTDDEIDKGPTTGDTLIYVVWLVGAGALGYSVYYFMKRKNNI